VSNSFFGRDLIRERTGEGRKKAMANRVKFGRKEAQTSGQRDHMIRRILHTAEWRKVTTFDCLGFRY
jgi:hypothetical protein